MEHIYNKISSAKTTEIIFKRASTDKKKKLNRSDKIISRHILAEIEKEGITSERLDTLDVPVYKYMTQITIHGKFPEVLYGRPLTYKSIIRNKNESIGIKYIAVDAAKKKKIFNTVKIYERIVAPKSSWYIRHNSTEYFMYKIYSVAKNTVEKIRQEAKTEIERIDTSLFIGNTDLALYSSPLFGAFFMSKIYIDAIYEKDVPAVIENICNKKYEKVMELVDHRKEEIRKEREEEEKWRQKLKEKKENVKKEAEKIISEDFTYGDHKIKENNVIVSFIGILSDRTTMEVSPAAYIYHFYLSGRKKRYRLYRIIGKENIEKNLIKIYDNVENIDPEKTKEYVYTGKYVSATFSGWIRKKKKASTIKKEKIADIEKKEGNINLEIIDYSEKAIAVIGDTKEVKDSLKKLNGRFNPRLRCGPGWIFPKIMKEDVENFIKEKIGREI